MDEKALKERLAAFDAKIKEAQFKVAEAQSELALLATQRRSFASIHCDHPRERRYERSVMGREIDVYCGVCETAL